jgi:hypothetical protein
MTWRLAHIFPGKGMAAAGRCSNCALYATTAKNGRHVSQLWEHSCLGQVGDLGTCRTPLRLTLTAHAEVRPTRGSPAIPRGPGSPGREAREKALLG